MVLIALTNHIPKGYKKNYFLFRATFSTFISSCIDIGFKGSLGCCANRPRLFFYLCPMNNSELRRSVQEALVLVEKTLLKKNEEYASDNDVFRNFRTGISLQSKPQAVAWEYMTKHLQWIKDSIQTNHKPTHAELDEKFIDAINYLLLIRAMYQEK